MSCSPAPKMDALYREVRSVLEQARGSAYRAVNFAMVGAYWQVGRLIVEHEQGGKRRAAYGAAILEELARRLTIDFGRGFDVRNLRYMRQFYLAYPGVLMGGRPADAAKGNALRSKFKGPEKRNAPRSKSEIRSELSWTHYRLLLGSKTSLHATGT